MLRCGHVDDVSYVSERGQGWWAGLLTVRLPLFFCCLFLTLSAIFHLIRWRNGLEQTQPPVMDVSARTTMKDAAKCDKHCELQDSVNQQEVEHMLLFRVFLESMFASLPFDCLRGVSLRLHASVFSCFNVALVALMHVCQSCLACATLSIFFGRDVTCDQAAWV